MSVAVSNSDSSLIQTNPDAERPLLEWFLPAIRFHRQEDGLVTWVSLVVIIFFLILLALVGNLGITINEKVDTQNSADAVAYSSATVMARGMNSLTATNHLMGELTALYTLHHALGSKYLDYNNRPNNDILMTTANGVMSIYTFLFAAPIPASPDEYYAVLENPVAGFDSTLYWAMLVLKGNMINAYYKHAKGAASIPIGFAAMAAARMEEAIIAREYRFLKQVEKFALNVKAIKKQIPSFLQAIHLYQKTKLVGYAQIELESTARTVGNANETIGTIGLTIGQRIPGATLPVQVENTRDEERSQLMRATWPWINDWRKPMQAIFLLKVPRSMATLFYTYFTHYHAERICKDFRQNKGLKLYVMRDYDASRIDKSQEPWNKNDGSNRADDLFCVMGFARAMEPPTIYASPFFRQANPDGVVCFSQALIYNANFQQAPARADGDIQAKVGWDTLNWKNKVPEYPSFFGNLIPLNLFDAKPQITLNWQAKLTPVTQRKLSQLMFAPITDSKTSHVFKDRLMPRTFYGKSLYTH